MQRPTHLPDEVKLFDPASHKVKVGWIIYRNID